MTTATPHLITDIDGFVIAYPAGGGPRNELTPSCIAAFRHVLSYVPNVRLVLSSQRRITKEMRKELDKMWAAEGLPPFVDATHLYGSDQKIIRAMTRGQEIATYLADHPEVTNWAVGDDDLLGINGVIDMDRVVITNPVNGLTLVGAERLIHILTTDVPTPTPPLAPVYADADL